MTLSIQVTSFEVTRQFEKHFFRVTADFGPFPGAYVSVTYEKSKNVTKIFAGNMNNIIAEKRIKQSKVEGSPMKLTKEQLAFLEEVSKLIEWGQKNIYWIEMGFEPYPANESDFQEASLQVSAL